MKAKITFISAILTLSLVSAAFLPSCAKVDTVIDTTAPVVTTVPTEAISGTTHPLTGEPGYDEAMLTQKNIGIVVENYPDARPQWGMSTPDILIEYEVEGGISRMLWLYADINEIPAVVGPVRSARHDIAELALGWDLTFIHCGGSSFADDFRKEHPELTDIDAMYSEAGFQRDQTRNVAREHRLTLLGEDFRNTLAGRNVNTTASADKKNIFSFAATNRLLTGQAGNSLSFSYSADYKYTFNYNAATGLYECILNGNPRVDDQNIQCAYHNVVMLYTDMTSMNNESGSQDLLLENGGTGYYLNGGVAESILWSKPTATDALKLMSADGNELILNPGNSYIGFVRSTQAGKTTLV